MFEIKEIFRIRTYTLNDVTLWYEVYNTTREVKDFLDFKLWFKKLNRNYGTLSNDVVCLVPVEIDKTAHTAQMIADALNMKLATTMAGVSTDDPWNLPVPLEMDKKD